VVCAWIRGKERSRPKTLNQKNDQNFHVSFSTIFCFIAFLGVVSQRGEFKNTKNVLPKNLVEKLLPKKSTKTSKPIFSCLIKNITQNLIPSLSLSWPLTYLLPTYHHHGDHRFVFGAPRNDGRAPGAARRAPQPLIPHFAPSVSRAMTLVLVL
jgi:hypothetical protein